MSKKSRKRNKKILAVLGALGGAALMARNKRNASIEANEAKESGFDIPPVTSTPKKKPTAVVTGTNYPGENKAKVFPKLKVSDKGYVTKNGVAQGFTGKGKFVTDDGIFVKGKKVSETAPKAILVRKDGTIKAGGKQFYDKNQYRTRNDKPGMLGDNYYKAPPVKSDLEQYIDNNPLSISAKKGGRIVKGKKTAVRTGAAKRGFGRAYLKGGKR